MLACVLLSVTLVTAGYAAVALPDAATTVLSAQFSGCDQPNTVFTKDELVSMAVAGKHYTFDTNDLNELNDAISAANRDAVEDGRSTQASTTSYRQSLDAESISHLDDVYQVAQSARPILVVLSLACLVALIATGACCGKQQLGNTVLASGALVVCVFAAFGIWAIIDFYGMFNTLHSLFFNAGTWVFEMDSLLITMYPTAFWMGMGAIWLVVSLVLSILAIVIGLKLRKQNYGKR